MANNCKLRPTLLLFIFYLHHVSNGHQLHRRAPPANAGLGFAGQPPSAPDYSSPDYWGQWVPQGTNINWNNFGNNFPSGPDGFSSNVVETTLYNSMTCHNGNCTSRVCFNNKCINSTKPLRTMQNGNCSMTVCDDTCDGFYIYTDKCPICRCAGYGTRNICDRAEDCTSGSVCQNSLCTISSIPPNLPKACSYAHQCASTEDCIQSACTPGSPVKHLENQSCVYDNMCPDDYTCANMTCWQSTSKLKHLGGVSCVFDYQCPSSYTCANMTCYATGGEHGNFPCVFTNQCPRGQTCSNMTCRAASQPAPQT